jgi:hypothetical protein
MAAKAQQGLTQIAKYCADMEYNIKKRTDVVLDKISDDTGRRKATQEIMDKCELLMEEGNRSTEWIQSLKRAQRAAGATQPGPQASASRDVQTE